MTASLIVPGWRTPGAAAAAFAGEIVLTLGVVALLVVPFFLPRQSRRVSAAVALLSLLVATFFTLAGPHIDGPQFAAALVSDPLARFWKVTLYLFTAGVIGLWWTSARHPLPDRGGTEFFVLLLGSTLGLSLMGGTDNLLLLLLASELASLPTYVLAGFRKNDRAAGEAALKYVLIGAISTGLMVYGLSLLFGMHGTLSFATVAQGLATMPGTGLLTTIGLLGLGVGLAFKLTAVPLHVWGPDVFDGAGVDVTAFLSVASKGAGLVLTARLVSELAAAGSPAAMTGVLLTLGVVAILTMTIGNLGALKQPRVKRLLAYSSIAHAGYLLATLCAFPGSVQRIASGVTVLLIYLAVYAAMNLVAFVVAAEVERATAGDGTLGAFAGLGARSPVLAASMTVAVVSMIGLPPAVGFVAKLKLLALLGGGGAAGWTLLAAVAFNTVISVYYYGRVLQTMYLRLPSPDAPKTNRGASLLAGAGAGMLIVGFFFFTRLESNAEAARPVRPLPSGERAGEEAIVVETRR